MISEKPVIFIDFGGVYFTSPKKVIPEFSKKSGLSPRKIEKILLGNWTTFAVGRMSENAYWGHFSSDLGLSDKQTAAFRNLWYGMNFNDGMKKLVSSLRKKYRVAALSSISSDWVKILEKKHNISKHFNECHYSFDHRCDKPGEKFFLSAAKSMNVAPQDCIVVDDRKDFLLSVKKTGAKTILFKNAKQLETELRKLGVDV